MSCVNKEWRSANRENTPQKIWDRQMIPLIASNQQIAFYVNKFQLNECPSYSERFRSLFTHMVADLNAVQPGHGYDVSKENIFKPEFYAQFPNIKQIRDKQKAKMKPLLLYSKSLYFVAAIMTLLAPGNGVPPKEICKGCFSYALLPLGQLPLLSSGSPPLSEINMSVVGNIIASILGIITGSILSKIYS